jgi:hypothetical protein
MDLDALLRFVDPYLDTDFRSPGFDPTIASLVLPSAGRSQALHEKLLQRHNGFYAFGGLLHVLGACSSPPNHSILAWNDAAGWRRSWGAIPDGCVFFAQTAFGDQFGYRGGKIVRFRALEGRVDAMHANLEEWLQAVVLDPEFSLDKRLFDACVRTHGPLPHGGHFAPVAGHDVHAPLDPVKMHVVPTRDSLETKAEHVKNGIHRRRSSMSFRPGT